MADISKEIQNFRSARRGKDVRGSMISLAEKVNKETTDAKAAAVNAAADAGVAASNASYAVNQANTAAQNANTAAQNIQTRADRGDFTGTIRIGEVTTGEPGSEATASNSGSAKDAVINLTIPQGYQGVSMRMAGAWTAGTEYVNNTSYIDLVTYNGGTYGCKQTHTASEDTTPTLERNEYWQVIAKKGDTGGIENIDTTPIEFKEAAERENIESGDSIPTMGGKIRKWFSDFKQAAFMNVVNGVTQSVAGQAVLDAAVGKYLDEKKLDISRIVANRNITELGFAMDGKTAADWLNELNGKLDSGIWKFSTHYIDDRAYSSHFDTLKGHWKSDLFTEQYNNWGFRFVTTHYGIARSSWLCWAYGAYGAYGYAINASYEGLLHFYQINNNVWYDRGNLAVS